MIKQPRFPRLSHYGGLVEAQDLHGALLLRRVGVSDGHKSKGFKTPKSHFVVIFPPVVSLSDHAALCGSPPPAPSSAPSSIGSPPKRPATWSSSASTGSTPAKRGLAIGKVPQRHCPKTDHFIFPGFQGKASLYRNHNCWISTLADPANVFTTSKQSLMRNFDASH